VEKEGEEEARGIRSERIEGGGGRGEEGKEGGTRRRDGKMKKKEMHECQDKAI
jgi:hypothetical protein